MGLIYNVAIWLFGLLVMVASIFNPKAKKWIVGRRNWKETLSKFSKENDMPVVWIHAASLGEFEQGRPIIEAIRHQYSNWAIVLSFFSPSGYEIRHDYDQVDCVTYLPLDTKSNAKDFIDMVNPAVAIFVKYEFWLNYLNVLEDRSVPHFLVSGIFREKQHFFKWYGSFFRNKLKGFDSLYVQDSNSEKLLQSIGLNNVAISGDTRFDRVLQIKSTANPLPKIKRFTESCLTIIIGSSWPKEEKQLLSFIKNNKDRNNLRFILAPHEIEKGRIDQFIKDCELMAMTYSAVGDTIPEDVHVLIIDSIGMLSRIYAYSNIAIIGGGFDAGIHNVLEAAVWEQPVLFGPNYHQFREAVGLIGEKGGWSYSSDVELSEKLNELLDQPSLLARMSRSASDYCKMESGATEIIMAGLKDKLID